MNDNNQEEQSKGLPLFFVTTYDVQTAKFTFEFSNEFVNLVAAHLSKPGQIVSMVLEKHPDFSKDFNSDVFGISGCLRKVSRTGNVYEFALPCLKKVTNTPCNSCGGTGTDSVFKHDPCMSCYGAKVEIVDDEKSTALIISFCQTIYLLTNLHKHFMLDYAEIDSRKTFEPKSFLDQQRSFLEISYSAGMHKAWIQGWVHDAVARFVTRLNRDQQRIVTSVMASVEAKLFMREPYEKSFRIVTNDDAFWLEVPGSASTLGTESDSGNFWPWGRLLSCHNIDHRIAQLCLIAGMATIDEMFLDSLK